MVKMRMGSASFLLLLLLVDPGSGHDAIYGGCGGARSCWGMGNHRGEKETKFDECWNGDTACAVAVLLEPPKDNAKTPFKFTIRYNTGTYGWGAMGIGVKEKMEDLLIMECVNDRDSGTAFTVISTNGWKSPGDPPERIVKGGEEIIVTGPKAPKFSLAEAQDSIVTSKIAKESFISCQFNLPPVFTAEGFKKFAADETKRNLSFDLVKDSYYFYAAAGSNSDLLADNMPDGTSIPRLTKHTIRARTEEKIHFTKVIKFSVEKTVYLQNAHGILMGVVYFVLLPLGLTMARFFKETWSRKQVCRRRLWFFIHVASMYLALVLYIAAWVSIGVDTGQVWPKLEGSKTHASIGVTSLAFLLCQVTLPWIVPKSIDRLRHAYSLVHFAMGLICYGLGVYNILMTPVNLPNLVFCTVILVTSMWIASHFGIYVFFTNLLIIKDHQMVDNDQRLRALTAYPMKGVHKRYVLLALLLTMSIGATVALSYQIGLNSVCKLYIPNDTHAEGDEGGGGGGHSHDGGGAHQHRR